MNRADKMSGHLDEGRVTFESQAKQAVASGSSRSNIALSETELRALCWALDNYLPGLRYDEARIKLERDRHEVVAREKTLSSLRERFEQALAAPDVDGGEK